MYKYNVCIDVSDVHQCVQITEGFLYVKYINLK